MSGTATLTIGTATLTIEKYEERPLLMQPDLVLATLEGEKHETRRIARIPDPNRWVWARRTSRRGFQLEEAYTDPGLVPEEQPGFAHWPVACPYGGPGDRLWIREPWSLVKGGGAVHGPYGDEYELLDFYRGSLKGATEKPRGWGLTYKADWLTGDLEGTYWRPSIHMPRWACRLVVRLTTVRLERLQAITEEGAEAEGVPPDKADWLGASVNAFAELWDEINGRRAPWAENPWVWVLGYEVVR